MMMCFKRGHRRGQLPESESGFKFLAGGGLGAELRDAIWDEMGGFENVSPGLH